MRGLHILMDGNNTAYRANCTSELYTKGTHIRTSAIQGVLNITHSSMLYLSDQLKLPVKQVIYLWDYGRSARRMEVYPEYKANRSHQDSDGEWFSEFIDQANALHEGLPFFGVKSFRKRGWEGDDLILGALKIIRSTMYFDKDLIVILSTDEDFHQLISENVYVFNPTRKVLYTPENYEELMGIPVELFLTYKILKGDSSDNIPGISGIGEKTGKALVNRYGNLESLLKCKDELIKSKRTSRIFTDEGLRVLERNDQLINLERYVSIEEIRGELEDMIDDPPLVEKKEAQKFLMKYQLASILGRFPSWIRDFQELTVSYLSD